MGSRFYDGEYFSEEFLQGMPPEVAQRIKARLIERNKMLAEKKAKEQKNEP
jgi:hypothetical protein